MNQATDIRKVSSYYRRTRMRLTAYFNAQRRDSRYVFVVLVAALLFIFFTGLAASRIVLNSFEEPVFRGINNLPVYLGPVMYFCTLFGFLGSVVVWCAAAWRLVNRRAALTVAGAALAAWLGAKIAKAAVHRGRPQAFLPHVHHYGPEILSGLGYPSGHSTLSAACATVLYFQVPRRYRKWLLLAVFLVGFSRLYLGAHFPLDVLGGWALGAIIGAAVTLLFGVSTASISAPKLKRILRQKGFPVRSLRYASVDARGSRPLFIVDETGNEYFGKLFGATEHAADWLFKLYRFFRYKNLRAETPYLKSRQAIALEAFATMWAAQNGVRVPKTRELIKIGGAWLLLQEKIDAKPLSEVSKIPQKSLEDVWEQVKKLHEGHMAHRDLRAANVMIDKKGQAWLIDFGFAEQSPRAMRQCMDIAELLASMSLVAGIKPAVSSARAVLGDERVSAAAPFLKKKYLSNATTKAVKRHKSLLGDLQAALQPKE